MCANCHVVTCEIEMKSLDAIAAAAKRLGWEFKHNQKTYEWYQKWVDDSPVPRHIFETEGEYNFVMNMTSEERKEYMTEKLSRCDHAIKIPNVDYEVGIVKVGEKYVPVWDWFRLDMRRVMGETGAPLSQAYAVEAAILEAQAHAYTYSEQTLEDGAIQLTIQTPDY